MISCIAKIILVVFFDPFIPCLDWFALDLFALSILVLSMVAICFTPLWPLYKIFWISWYMYINTIHYERNLLYSISLDVKVVGTKLEILNWYKKHIILDRLLDSFNILSSLYARKVPIIPLKQYPWWYGWWTDRDGSYMGGEEISISMI